VRIIVEFRIDQVRELARPPMDLDDVGALHVAEVGPAAALVNTQERFEGVQGTSMDVEVVRQELAHGRALARLIDGGRVSGLEEQGVGSLARFLLADGLAVSSSRGDRMSIELISDSSGEWMKTLIEIEQGLGLEGPKMAFESDLGQLGRMASVDQTEAG